MTVVILLVCDSGYSVIQSKEAWYLYETRCFSNLLLIAKKIQYRSMYDLDEKNKRKIFIYVM